MQRRSYSENRNWSQAEKDLESERERKGERGSERDKRCSKTDDAKIPLNEPTHPNIAKWTVQNV